jgi:ABC-type phosphate transport system permease subunit
MFVTLFWKVLVSEPESNAENHQQEKTAAVLLLLLSFGLNAGNRYARKRRKS